MGRRWLGVSTRKFLRMPHGAESPPSLWWHSRLSPANRHRVIEDYIGQCSLGITLPEDFREKLGKWVHDLSRPHNLAEYGRPGKGYWDIVSYARAHKLHPKTLAKRFREMEKIAMRLFPTEVPPGRIREPISEETKLEIRRRYLQGQNVSDIAAEFNIKPFRVGQICREEKKQRAAAREKAESESVGSNAQPAAPDDLEYPF